MSKSHAHTLRKRSPHVLLFDLYTSGHHSQYLYNLAEYWVDKSLPGRLSIVVPPALQKQHESVAQYILSHADAGLYLVLIEEDLGGINTASTAGLLRVDRLHGRILKRYIQRLRPDHATMMYIDHCQVSLMTDLRLGYNVALSGVYFRPSFHYTSSDDGVRGPAARISRIRKKVMLRGALSNPHLSHLFCLDPFVVPVLNGWGVRAQAVHLPDGVRLQSAREDSQRIRRGWGAESRCVALLFGVLDSRKGLYQVTEAVLQLPRDVQDRVHLVLAGPVPDREQERLRRSLAQIRRETNVRVTLDDRYVPESEVQQLLAAADVVLVPYQREHVGSSNVLMRAAAAGVPVVGTSSGLIGGLIRKHQLGATLDASESQELALALEGFVRNPRSISFDKVSADAFARANSAERMGATFFGHLFDSFDATSQVGTAEKVIDAEARA